MSYAGRGYNETPCFLNSASMFFHTCSRLFLLSVLSLGGCASYQATDTSRNETARISRAVTGTVSYRERIALPPSSVIRVTLEDVSLADVPATVIAETTLRPDRQVPIPFTLSYDPARIDPAHRYAVRAQITDADGRLRWTTMEYYGVLTQKNPEHVELIVRPVRVQPQAQNTALPETMRTFVFSCGDLDFIVIHPRPDVAELYLPDRKAVLPQVLSGSGAKYQEGGLMYWNKGREAMLEVDGRRYEKCRLDPARSVWEDARQRGIEFRALGNEPGWHLEIEKGRRIVFVTDYGKTKTYTPVPQPTVSGGRATYRIRTEAHDLTVLIERRICRDTMSGEAFEAFVMVRLDGREYRGCGQALQ